jgi:hypothetical protein
MHYDAMMVVEGVTLKRRGGKEQRARRLRKTLLCPV